MRVRNAVKDQQERVFQAGQQVRQIAFLILTARLDARDDALMHGTFRLGVQHLLVGNLDNDALCFQRFYQRLQATVFTPFQDKDFLETLRIAVEQRLHGVDTKNNFTHGSGYSNVIFI